MTMRLFGQTLFFPCQTPADMVVGLAYETYLKRLLS